MNQIDRLWRNRTALGLDGTGPLLEVWSHGVGLGTGGYILMGDIDQAKYAERVKIRRRKDPRRKDPKKKDGVPLHGSLDKEMIRQRRFWKRKMKWYKKTYMPGVVNALKKGPGKAKTTNGMYKLDKTEQGKSYLYDPKALLRDKDKEDHKDTNKDDRKDTELRARVTKPGRKKAATPAFAQWDVPWGDQNNAVLCHMPADGGGAPNVMRFVNKEAEEFQSMGVTFQQWIYRGKGQGSKQRNDSMIVWLYGKSVSRKSKEGTDEIQLPKDNEPGWVIWKSIVRGKEERHLTPKTEPAQGA